VKNLLCALLAAVALSGCATMDRANPQYLRAAFHTMNVADAGTTMARDPACMSEGSWMLGDDPSDGQIAAVVLAQSAIYEGLYWWVREYRPAEQQAFGWAFLIVKSLGVGWNAGQLAKGCD
jgi:hypothetical protein